MAATMSQTAMEALRAPPASVQCPRCEHEFDCDACMHVHLMNNYRLRYVDVFGHHSEAWLDFCDDHAHCTPSMLGL